MADQEADKRFFNVYLSNGAGQDYRGGAALYVDDHPSKRCVMVSQWMVELAGLPFRLAVLSGVVECQLVKEYRRHCKYGGVLVKILSPSKRFP